MLVSPGPPWCSHLELAQQWHEHGSDRKAKARQSPEWQQRIARFFRARPGSQNVGDGVEHRGGQSQLAA